MSLPFHLQQLQMSRNAIHHTLGSQNPQHRATSTGDLSPSGILDHPRAKSETDGLRLE